MDYSPLYTKTTPDRLAIEILAETVELTGSRIHRQIEAVKATLQADLEARLRLNHLLLKGHDAGDIVDVRGSLYRTSESGGPAFYVGTVLPVSCPDDDSPTAADILAERESHYHHATRPA